MNNIDRLCSAAWDGQYDDVLHMIQANTALNHVSPHRLRPGSALLCAACNGHAHIVDLLLASGAVYMPHKDTFKTIIPSDIMQKIMLFEQSHSMLTAILKGQLLPDMIQKADVNIKTKQGYTLLMAAVDADNRAMIQHLLTLGADVNARDACGRTAWMLSYHASNKKVMHAYVVYSPYTVLGIIQGQIKNKDAIQKLLIESGAFLEKDSVIPDGLLEFAEYHQLLLGTQWSYHRQEYVTVGHVRNFMFFYPLLIAHTHTTIMQHALMEKAEDSTLAYHYLPHKKYTHDMYHVYCDDVINRWMHYKNIEDAIKLSIYKDIIQARIYLESGDPRSALTCIMRTAEVGYLQNYRRELMQDICMVCIGRGLHHDIGPSIMARALRMYIFDCCNENTMYNYKYLLACVDDIISDINIPDNMRKMHDEIISLNDQGYEDVIAIIYWNCLIHILPADNLFDDNILQVPKKDEPIVSVHNIGYFSHVSSNDKTIDHPKTTTCMMDI